MLRRLFILITCLLTCSVTVQAATPEQFVKVASEGKQICKLYRTTCTVRPVAHEKLWAITKPFGEIEISTGMIEKLNEAQLRGVIYHEVGHRVLQHVEKTAEYIYISKYNKTFNQEVLNDFRRKNELQADKFAIYFSLFTLRNIDLKGALLIITPKQDMYITGNTHPSTADRIKNIRRLYYGQIK